MSVLDIIIVLLIISWLGGSAFQIGGSLIHILLVVALIIFILRLLGIRT